MRQPGFQTTRWEAVEAIGCPRTTWEMVGATRSSSNGMEGVYGFEELAEDGEVCVVYFVDDLIHVVIDYVDW